MTIEIHADPITVNCRKVLAGMKLLNAPYRLVHVDYFKGEHKQEPFLSLNPNAAVPALRDGGFELWESNAMLQYVADKVGAEAVYPHDPQQRADIHRWMYWESASWFPSCYVFLVENCVKPLLGGQADPAVLAAQLPTFHKLAGILERRLEGRDWLVGNGPTIADIAVAAPMHLHAWQQLPLADHPNLSRWLTRNVESLPCWQETTVYEGFTTQRPA